MVIKPENTSGSLIHHFYIKKNFDERSFINTNAENIHFSDHDAIKL